MNAPLHDEGITSAPFPLLELLDQPDRLMEVLEELLVSPRLLDLVEQLSLLHSSEEADVPAELRSRILTSGLAGLGIDDRRLLLTHPRALLALQPAVLLEGGPYWDTVLARSRKEAPPAPVITTPAPPQVGGAAWYRSPWAWAANALTGLAAALAVFAFGARTSHEIAELRKEREVQVVRAKALEGELEELRRMLPPYVTPPNLPDSHYDSIAFKDPDPSNLPESDPPDLPKT